MRGPCKVKWCRVEDLSGQRFGRLQVIRLETVKTPGGAFFLCQCDCGNTKIVRALALKREMTQSCGCLNKELTSQRSFKDLTGQKFGRLMVIGLNGINKFRHRTWRCLCECGKESTPTTHSLKSGNTQSCGCLNQERVREAIGRPDITLEQRRLLYGRSYMPENYQWRKEILARDNYKCVLCGEGSKLLYAHHKNGWQEYPDQRFLVDNGITLCVDCHKDFHKIFGKGHNTQEQWLEYLGVVDGRPTE